MCWFLYFPGPLNHRFARKLVTWTKLHGQGLLKCQISWHHGNHLNGEMPERLNGPVSKTGVGATLPGVQIPLSPPLYQWLISRLPTLLFLNRTIVEYSWRVRSSLFSVRYCDIQHLIPMDLTGSFRAKMCSYSVVFLSLTIILLDIHPMKLPQSWWWELKLRREGVNNWVKKGTRPSD